MRMVPDRNKNDKKSSKIVGLSLRIDAGAALSEYLIHKIKVIFKYAYTGKLYDFLKDDLVEINCGMDEEETGPEVQGSA